MSILFFRERCPEAAGFFDKNAIFFLPLFHFVDPGDSSDEWNTLLAVTYDTVSNEMSFVPIVNTENGITLAREAEKNRLLSEFACRNEELQQGAWKAGWQAFCRRMGAKYVKVLGNAGEDSTERQNANFAHFLDCQAHTDVLRELFPTYNQTNEK